MNVLMIDRKLYTEKKLDLIFDQEEAWYDPVLNILYIHFDSDNIEHLIELCQLYPDQVSLIEFGDIAESAFERATYYGELDCETGIEVRFGYPERFEKLRSK